VRSDPAYRISPGHTVPDLVHVRLHVACDDTAAGHHLAERHALLIGPDDHLQRVASAQSCGRERFKYAQYCLRIEARIETCGTHQVDHVPTTGEIRIRIGDATDPLSEAAAGRPPEHAQRFKPLSQRCGIDTRRWLLREGATAQDDRTGGGGPQSCQERAPG
jgi:glutathione S-transferase